MLLPLALLLVSSAWASPAQNYLNTAVVRTIELGGATTSSSTQYSVKAVVDSPGAYHLALTTACAQGEAAAWWEVSVGGKVIAAEQAIKDGAPYVKVDLGLTKRDETATISLSEMTSRASSPLPAAIAQQDSQFLLWRTNATYVDSWYRTDVERIKIRAPTPNILSYPSLPTSYTRDNVVTRAGATLTLGPFYNLLPTLGSGSDAGPLADQVPFSVHYEHKDAVMAVRSLRRGVEVSHWGANVNTQDEIDLVNIGPKLKGHFSRLAHQQSRFHASVPPQIFTELTLRVPPQAHSVYYYDTIGNVSTSHFRPGVIPPPSASSTSSAKKIRTQRVVDGQVELKPRYPILGGWNYSFIVGYDQPAGDVLKVDAKDGKRVLGVPFFTPVKDLVLDQVEMQIVLPEGAKDVEVFTPFAVDSIEHSIIKTYLDTTGRHAVTLRKSRCTENHAESIYVRYTYPTSALLQKPLAVASIVGGVFVLAMGLKRVDWSIEKKIK